MSESAVYRWPDAVKRAVKLMAGDGLVTALHLRRRVLAKAMLVKVRGLDTDDERLRQQTATEIIEWELGKATQKSELSGPNGKPIESNVVIDVDSLTDEENAILAEAIRRTGAGKPPA
jgi:hypothetical protein